METFSLAPSPPFMVPDDRPFDQAQASGTGRHPGADPGVGEGGRPAQSPAAVGTQCRRRWHRALTWGSLGLLVSGVGGVPWLSRQPPLVPPRPPIHSDFAAAARPGAAVPAVHSPTQGQSPAGRASLVGAPPGGTSPGLPLQPPPAALGQGAAPRAVRVGPPHARKRQAPAPPRMRVRAPQGGASRLSAWSTPLPAPPPSARWNAPSPAQQGAGPWHGLPTTGDG